MRWQAAVQTTTPATASAPHRSAAVATSVMICLCVVYDQCRCRVSVDRSKACNRKVVVRRNAAKAGRPRRRPAQVSSDGFDESDRSQPAYQKILKDIREAVSDRGRGVRSRGERPPTRGAPNHRR